MVQRPKVVAELFHYGQRSKVRQQVPLNTYL